MKLTEIMIIKKDDTGNRLKLFQVDDSTLAKLTRIRGNLYADDPRLRIAKDHPTPELEPKISPEQMARAEASWAAHYMERQAIQTGIPEPKPVLSFEEQIKNDWRFTPGIRSEFISLTSYEAYRRAVRDGRTRVCGR